MFKSDLNKKAKSLIEVKVAPKKSPARWKYLFKFIDMIRRSPEAKKTKDKVKEYLEERVEGGIDAARSKGIANLKMQAEVENLLKQSQASEDDNRRKNSKFESEIESRELANKKTQAEINKLNAESLEIETSSKLKLLEEMEKRGFNISIDISGDGTPTLVVVSDRVQGQYVDIPNDFYHLQSKAKIPVLQGTSGKVIDVLNDRQRGQDWGMEAVASDISVTKKELRRALKNENVSFAALRDRVRFNHSFNYLLIENFSIEKTSEVLGFSDRTSFTHAFKRWSGLSPSKFKCMYRDCV